MNTMIKEQIQKFHSDLQVITETWTHVLVVKLEQDTKGPVIVKAQVFEKTKHTGSAKSPGYIGDCLVEINRCDVGEEKFMTMAKAAFKSLSK